MCPAVHWHWLVKVKLKYISWILFFFFFFWESMRLCKLTRQKKKNVVKGCLRLTMWREIFNFTSRKHWKKTMYSEAISARVPWFVIWVRQLLLAQQVKPLLIIAHWTAVVCPVSQSPVAHPFKVGPLFKNVTSKYTWVLLSCYCDTKNWNSLSVEVDILRPLWVWSLLLHLPHTGCTSLGDISSLTLLSPMGALSKFGLTKSMKLPEVKCWNSRARVMLPCLQHLHIHFL